MKGFLVRGLIVLAILIACAASALGNRSARAPSYDIHLEAPTASFDSVKKIVDELKAENYLIASGGQWMDVGGKNLYGKHIWGNIAAFQSSASGLVGDVYFKEGKGLALHPLEERQLAQINDSDLILPWIQSDRLRNKVEKVKALESYDKGSDQRPTLILLSESNQEGEAYQKAKIVNTFSSMAERVEINNYADLQKKSERQWNFFALGMMAFFATGGLYRWRKNKKIQAVLFFGVAAGLAVIIDYASLPLEGVNENLVSLTWYLQGTKQMMEQLFLAHQRMMSQAYLQQLVWVRVEGLGLLVSWLSICIFEKRIRRIKDEGK